MSETKFMRLCNSTRRINNGTRNFIRFQKRSLYNLLNTSGEGFIAICERIVVIIGEDLMVPSREHRPSFALPLARMNSWHPL